MLRVLIYAHILCIGQYGVSGRSYRQVFSRKQLAIKPVPAAVVFPHQFGETAAEEPQSRYLFHPPPPPPPRRRWVPSSFAASASTSLIGGALYAGASLTQEGAEHTDELHDPLVTDDILVETPHSNTAFVKRSRSFRNHVDGVRDQFERLKTRASDSFLPSSAGADSHEIARPVVAGFFRALGPALVAVFGCREVDGLMNFRSLYAWALVGSSVGFYLFLYFISVGYTLGIALPVAATLIRYLHTSTSVSTISVLHSVLVLTWAARLLAFLVWREYCSWPALHAKIVQVNQSERSPALHQKILCWLLYSFLYVCMLSPCWFRMESDIANAGVRVKSTVAKFASGIGIVFQVLGLVIESVADWQKSAFKVHHRSEWCNRGLWKFSTHPNYAGEILFWFGTVTVGLPALARSPMAVCLVQGIVVLIGFAFLVAILTGAAEKLSQKQQHKYGSDPAYVEYIANTRAFGPTRRRTLLGKTAHETAPTVVEAV